MAKVYGIIAIKGGVGKTTTVTNLGASLAKDFGKKVLIVDGNFSAPNLGLHLGIVQPIKNIHTVLYEGVPCSEAIQNHDEGFDLLPSAMMYDKKIEPKQFKEIISKIKTNYDFVLIDSSPALNDEMLATMISSDELLVVTTPDFPTLSLTMRAVKIAKHRGTKITGLILNKVRNKKFELSLDDIEDATKTPVLAILPDDVRVLEALAAAKPVVSHSSGREIAVSYKKLASCLAGEEFKLGFFTRLKRFFVKDVPKDEINRMLIVNKEE